MPRELRTGARVRTPRGVGTIAEQSEYRDAYRVVMDGVGSHWWDTYDVAPLTEPGIPRERVADLHAAVAKRVSMLTEEMTHEGHEHDDLHGYPHPRTCLTCTRDEESEVVYCLREGEDALRARDLHAELSEVAESLRLLLEVPDDAA